ncbi:putative thiamine transport system permease protein [Aliiroseovarius sediminilitoris]|uniref:Putative thiamine transport system permease protein n=1 Tax=Aliiroseovarius sediminilitoris TaxID=1173584 RepID=A0A1I0RA19_9RHOB|nr:ABC transporter permease subunit [Aliiroseovarius sediminilitoris]SEW37665.1 putative thiamine transport system permease protein [Aliiroseovarius sediminilitoris]
MAQTRKFLHLPLFPVLTVLVLLGPVAAGLWGTLLPAFGHLPTTGRTGLTLDIFRTLFDWPGFGPAVRLSVVTGLTAAILSLTITALILAGWAGTQGFRVLERLLSPFLSVPHAAAAFGLAFLIAPSGWIVRLFSPWLTGWDRPPDLLILNDPWGISLILGMVMKEVPFLLLMSIAALGQIDDRRRLALCQSMGYGRILAWLVAVFPAVYGRIRLPVLVVLTWSMSVVDVAVILGPSTPPTLSVQIVRWMSDPDLVFRLQAAAAALVQLALVIGVVGFWFLGEKLVAHLVCMRIETGRRGHRDRPLRMAGFAAGTAISGVLLLGLLSLAIWSVAGFWTFPDLTPDQFTTRNWMRHKSGSLDAFFETMLIAGIAVAIGMVLTIGCLETEHRRNLRLTQRGMWLIYLPLIVPQTAFLPGLQTLFLSLGLDMGRGPVVLAHLVFVLPYLRLSLDGPWQAWDNRQATVAAALGSGPNRVLWYIRLPMLLAPLLTAIAVGVAVSVGQYLPTLLVGGGRIETLTTEAVALASGGDRRAIGVFGLMQTAAALVPFALALTLPALIWRNRKGLLHG